LSGTFPIENGLQQGNALTPLFFKIKQGMTSGVTHNSTTKTMKAQTGTLKTTANRTVVKV
jgi:hypothetical protein